MMDAAGDMQPRWTVGDEIRKARRARGLEQADLARIVGVSRSTVSNWENGRGEPTVSQMRAIADATGEQWLLGARPGHIISVCGRSGYSQPLRRIDDDQLRLPIGLPPARTVAPLSLVDIS